jgi:acetyl-CoA acetyltransferase
LAKLAPAFAKQGVLTVGNSSQISDGAAALLVASEQALKKHKLKPIARVLGGAWAAGESWRYVEAPVGAVKKLMNTLDKSTDDFDLIENNEAFAVNSVLLSNLLGVGFDRLNVNGGSIAVGHPVRLHRRADHWHVDQRVGGALGQNRHRRALSWDRWRHGHSDREGLTFSLANIEFGA